MNHHYEIRPDAGTGDWRIFKQVNADAIHEQSALPTLAEAKAWCANDCGLDLSWGVQGVEAHGAADDDQQE